MLISTITTPSNNALPVVTSSTTSPPAMNSHITGYVTETCNAYDVTPSIPMTIMVYNISMEPLPLISAAYQSGIVNKGQSPQLCLHLTSCQSLHKA